MTDLITAEEAEKLLDGPLLTGLVNEHRALLLQAIGTDDADAMAYSKDGKPIRRVREITSPAKQAAEVIGNLARTVIALQAQLADAQAAQAMVGEKADRECRRAARTTDSPNAQFVLYKVADAIRDLAPASGLAMLAELQAERDAASAMAATAYGASLNWEEVLSDEALWQAQDDIAKSRVACIAAEADRDRLAAANAVLEAKVAGLVDALKPFDAVGGTLFSKNWNANDIVFDGGPMRSDCLFFEDFLNLRAALATQGAGNAQSTPPISPEEAQFNAVRHHERFGPLDEKGNPIDPRRRG